MQLSARSYALTVTNSAAVLGVPLPAGYRDELDQADRLAAAVSAITTTTPSQFTHAAISALEECRDLDTDPDVARLALFRSLASQGLEQVALSRADDRLRSVLTEYADAILTGWADALDVHVEAFEDAAEAFPDLNLDDGAGAVARGGAVMAHLHAVQVGQKAWSAAFSGFCALSAVARVDRNREQPDALIYTPARAAEFSSAAEAARTGRSDLAWTLARHGIPLRLATLTEYRERATRFERDRLAAQQEFDARRAEAGFESR